MMFADSIEPDDVIEAIRQKGVKIEKRMLYTYKCPQCGEWVFGLLEKCNICGTPQPPDAKKEHVADYAKDDGSVGIERKDTTTDDFYKSLLDGRFYDQCKKGAACFGSCFEICLEGRMEDMITAHPSQIDWIYGAQGEALWAYQIHFTECEYTRYHDAFANHVMWADRKGGHAPKQRMTAETMASLDTPPQVRAICDCPRIGEEKGKMMAFAFGTLKAIINLPPDIIGKLYGFGDKDVEAWTKFVNDKIQIPKTHDADGKLVEWQPKKRVFK